MPFCTECGARHAEGAKVCPNCGEPIFEPPSDDLDDIVASLDRGVQMGDEMPDVDDEAAEGGPAAGPSPDYMDQIDQIRAQIAAQSSSLQDLTDLSWSNPEAATIRDELAAALTQLRQLRPPPRLASAHADFAQGAALLAAGFQQLVDAQDQPNAEAAAADAETVIAQATNRFLQGADALNEYFTLQEAGLADDMPQLPEVPTPPETDEDGEEDEEEEEIPPLPPSLEELDLPGPVPAATPAVRLGGPSSSFLTPPPAEEPAADLDYSAEAQAGAWLGLGDPSTDRLLLEIEGGWVRTRPQVHEAIERAIRAAVADALRSSLGTRLRIEQEARAALERVASDRNRLIDEVEALRREAHQLQTELADLRRTLNELERERQIAQERRQQMFQDAETHRGQLLREIEQLGGQLDSMRQNIVSLLNMSAGAATTPEPAMALSAPSAPAAPRPAPALAAAPAPSAERGTAAGLTAVRISGVTSLAKNMQIQRAIRTVPGVAIEGQPRYRNGVLTATLRHDPSFDVSNALAELPDSPLSLVGAPEPGVLELSAT